MGQDWENEFRRFHPEVKFDLTNLKSSLIATAGLVSGLADIAANRHITYAEVESFERMYDHSPFGITMCTGAYDVNGWMAAFCIVVHRDNPLRQISVEQLDGVFGTARDGGWDGTTWRPEVARSAKDNIRRWGQLGLTGGWAEARIRPYGPPATHPGGMSYFQIRVLHGADTRNEELREFAD